MKLSPKHIIFISVSNYLSATEVCELKDEIAKFDRVPDAKFIKIVERHFDFNKLKDSPVIPEDIWLYNYLMYENKKKDNHKIHDIGEKINFKGRLLKKGLIVQYETKVILPQLKALLETNMIISNLD